MNFSFYTIDSHYCDYLREADSRVPHTMDAKASRPFIGIVLEVNTFHYYAPLTSPKPKHLHMKNQLDFLKINVGKWGAINFNNMIPVPLACLTKVNPKITDTDSPADIDYKNLLANQLSWCNANRAAIFKQAEKLYGTVTRKTAREALINRCCNFSLDEERCISYMNRKSLL